MNADEGATLCAYHARQAAGTNPAMPSGACSPSPSWMGGHGQTVSCDMVADPERVRRYIDHITTPDPRRAKGKWAHNDTPADPTDAAAIGREQER
jgi:hypothetical protein